jgi:hypothetical protein
MKVKVTEEKLYPIFKKFMETYFKKYEWIEDNYDVVLFMSPGGDSYLALSKDKTLLIYAKTAKKILNFLPMERSMFLSLMTRWVGETLNIKGITLSQFQQLALISLNK